MDQNSLELDNTPYPSSSSSSSASTFDDIWSSDEPEAELEKTYLLDEDGVLVVIDKEDARFPRKLKPTPTTFPAPWEVPSRVTKVNLQLGLQNLNLPSDTTVTDKSFNGHPCESNTPDENLWPKATATPAEVNDLLYNNSRKISPPIIYRSVKVNEVIADESYYNYKVENVIRVSLLERINHGHRNNSRCPFTVQQMYDFLIYLKRMDQKQERAVPKIRPIPLDLTPGEELWLIYYTAGIPEPKFRFFKSPSRSKVTVYCESSDSPMAKLSKMRKYKAHGKSRKEAMSNVSDQIINHFTKIVLRLSKNKHSLDSQSSSISGSNLN